MHHPVIYQLIKELLFQHYHQLWKRVQYDHGLKMKEIKSPRVLIYLRTTVRE